MKKVGVSDESEGENYLRCCQVQIMSGKLGRVERQVEVGVGVRW